jgi:hypothetical protein
MRPPKKQKHNGHENRQMRKFRKILAKKGWFWYGKGKLSVSGFSMGTLTEVMVHFGPLDQEARA